VKGNEVAIEEPHERMATNNVIVENFDNERGYSMWKR
jgi:hypothetical protein